jgi:hypothetical protein
MSPFPPTGTGLLTSQEVGFVPISEVAQLMATKRKPPESGSQIQNLMSRIKRPSMLALTSDDTP